MTVEKFRGDYYPFSNMYPLRHAIPTDCGIDVPTSEHAYMSNRFVNPALQREVALARAKEGDRRTWANGKAAHDIAHSFIEHGAEQIFNDDFAKVALMRRVVTTKLEYNSEIVELLLSTGSEQIEEGNDWDDDFWGITPIGSGNGQNHLGRIYMELRESLR